MTQPTANRVRLSIVVPNYNGARTLDAALQSLIDQDYPDLEIIVVDGGSTDDSVRIIRRHAPRLTWWVSGTDGGQSQALNKGFARCTGQVVGWLCSDDRLLPGALETVAQCFAETPDIDVIAGRCRVAYPGTPGRDYVAGPTLDDLALVPAWNPVKQPSCFFRRALLNRSKPIDESYVYAMDFELWNYFRSQGARWRCTDEVLSVFSQDGQNKSMTGGSRIVREQIRIYNAYANERIPLAFWHRWLRHPVECLWARHPSSFYGWLFRPYWKTVSALLSLFYDRGRVFRMNWRWMVTPHP